ncbi:uncharacterized protein MCYG_05771 [Microsporum canis CBS 113480]|uniref:Uncharacterized protein n=1 Tax=Arthroderma otae (strain ATCC MYA-4605 / CBS 113480) TaxID=554155 RepID=C5FSU9_ARTOC|nr:uncharacterized protein MCYG_05771 [Microsporum canis CBS 113480]EEQ32952.1 predicted protein [Microsporum canis CBS 113480]
MKPALIDSGMVHDIQGLRVNRPTDAINLTKMSIRTLSQPRVCEGTRQVVGTGRGKMANTCIRGAAEEHTTIVPRDNALAISAIWPRRVVLDIGVFMKSPCELSLACCKPWRSWQRKTRGLVFVRGCAFESPDSRKFFH